MAVQIRELEKASYIKIGVQGIVVELNHAPSLEPLADSIRWRAGDSMDCLELLHSYSYKLGIHYLEILISTCVIRNDKAVETPVLQALI